MKFIIGLFFSVFLTVSYAKPLVIGVLSDTPPFSSLVDGNNKFYGFEIELMTEICTRIGAECKFQEIELSEVRKDLDDNKIDLAIAEINPPLPDNPLAANYIFSIPYFVSSAQFLVRADSGITTLEGIRNKVVGVRFRDLFSPSLFKDFLLNLYNQQIKVKIYPYADDMVSALDSREVQAVFANTQLITYWDMNDQDKFEIIGNPFPLGNGYSIMGRTGEEALMDKINQAVYAIEDDGTYLDLYENFFTLRGTLLQQLVSNTERMYYQSYFHKN